LVAVGVNPLVSMAHQFLREEGQPMPTSIQLMEQQHAAQGGQGARDGTVPSTQQMEQQAIAHAQVCVRI
jgi:hypothetical protein